MNKVRELNLPTIKPSQEAMNSGNHNKYNYESESWELEYESYRYLKDLDNISLTKRYQGILRNMRRLVSEERHIIPIKSYLSSWYWFRKEHHTRLEFFLRKHSLPEKPPMKFTEINKDETPEWPKRPNACDVLFRFGKESYMIPMLKEGKVRVSPASIYSDGIAGDPRTDNELKKTSFLPKSSIRLTTVNGVNLPVKGNLSRSISSSNYYVLCASCGYHPELFSDFKSDCCIVITDPNEFEDRIERAMNIKTPGWEFIAIPVQYYDPYELSLSGYLDPVLSKDFLYAYQMEYRFAWRSLDNSEAEEYIYLNLDSLEDIAYLYRLKD